MTWVIFWSSVALALGALAWVTVEVIALEKREASSHIEAQRQESIRRALWRMDSRMAPILAIEASRPYSDYKSLDDAGAQWLTRASGASPATNTPAGFSYANSYFEFDQPTVPNAQSTKPEREKFVGMIQSKLTTDRRAKAAQEPVESADEQIAFGFGPAQSESGQIQKQEDSDFDARRRVAELASKSTQSDGRYYDSTPQATPSKDRSSKALKGGGGGGQSPFVGGQEPSSDLEMAIDSREDSAQPINQDLSTLRPRWVADDNGTMQLVLVRSAVVESKPVVQGVWLDWPSLRADLLGSVSDVLPGSSLVPVRDSGSSMVGVYQLATIPVAFIPPSNPISIPWRWSPATVGLLVTWIAIIATIIAVGVVLRAAIVLSERRGRFVSAVTHELRTPLTTFRLYAQMLADGMVTDEQVRTDYLSILKRESERLTGIVENVLEYARLTRQRSSKSKPAGVQTLSPGALIARFRPALARRAGQSNLDLVVSMDLEEHQDRTLTVDPHAVERIMMNLIENACKYAAPAEDDDVPIEELDTRIHLDVTVHADTLELLVADHGPGIRPGEGARIFGEFQRGWRGLSNARSGLGLGLALSRGLAREMEGDLVLTKRRGHGAEFLLSIPLDIQAVQS
jgi:signal transduction histidine kinase